MEKIYNLLTKKEADLDSLEKEKKELQDNMANPRDINNNAQKIEEVKSSIELLREIPDLAHKAGSSSAEQILQEMENYCDEVKTYVAANETLSKDMDKIVQVFENVRKDLISLQSSENTESAQDLGSSAQNSSSSTSGSKGAAISGEQSSKTTEDTDSTDFGDFDEPG